MSEEAPENTGDEGQEQEESSQPKTLTLTQDELNKMLADQKRKATSRFKDYDELREKASQLDALAAASQTDVERAAREARDAASKETAAGFVPRLVRAEFKAAAKGVLSADQLSALLEDLDLSKYVKDDGEADEDRIAKKIAAIAPRTEEKDRNRFPNLGGGQRGRAPKNQNMSDVIRRAAGIS